MSENNTTPEQRDTIRRDSVALANANSLGALLRQHDIFIPAWDFPNWRPTQRVSGSIPGVADSVTIIATNGVTGYFLYDGSERFGEVLYGHTQRFSGRVAPLHSVGEKKATAPKVMKERKKKPKKSLDERIQQMLETLRAS